MIKKYKTIVIARHIGPDPDALGSQIAFRDIILNTFPNKKVYAVGAPTIKFKFIGKLDKMKEEYYQSSLLIVFDTPEQRRIDGVKATNFDYVIKIDHHPLMEKFADIEWVDPLSSSTCQMIMELVFKSKLKMTTYAAERLFLGLVADTERFLYDYTSVKTFALTKQLLDKTKINIGFLYDQLYLRSLNEIRLQGYMASEMIITEYGVGYIILTAELIKKYKVDAASAGNLISYFSHVKELYIWLAVSEDLKLKTFRINIRSRGPIINQLAEQYNGGGHKYASGARVNTLDEALALIKALDNLSKKYQIENKIIKGGKSENK